MNDTPTATPTAPPTARPNAATIDTEADPLSAMMDRIDAAASAGQTATVHLFRSTDAGRELVARVPGPAFDAFAVGERWGAGRYFARLRVGGEWHGSATFAAAGKPLTGAGVGVGPAPASLAPSGGLDTTTLFQAMMQMQANATSQMTAIMTAVLSRQSDGLKPADLIALLKSRSEVGELVAGMKALNELAPTNAGGGGEGGGDLAALLSAVAPAMIAANARAPQAAPRRMPPPAAPQPRTPTPPAAAPVLAATAAAPPMQLPPGPAWAAGDELTTPAVAAAVLRMHAAGVPAVIAGAAVASMIQHAANGPELIAMIDGMGENAVADELAVALSPTFPATDSARAWLVGMVGSVFAEVFQPDDDADEPAPATVEASK